MRRVRTSPWCLAALATMMSGCAADGITGPSRMSLAGEWTGTFTVTGCAVSGMHTGCRLATGSTQPAVLALVQDEDAISGIAVYGEIESDTASDWYHPFTTTLGADARLSISTGWGRPPTTITKLEWDLRLEGPDRLVGTLRSTFTWYKMPGSAVNEGTVTVTRQARRSPAAAGS